MWQRVERSLALWVVAVMLIIGSAQGAGEVAFFQLGEGGGAYNLALPTLLAQQLEARGLVGSPLAPRALTWRQALLPGESARLVVAACKLGTRLEVIALSLQADGTVSAACRRPATSTFDVRLDRGQPGARQALENAFVELSADLARLSTAASSAPVVTLQVEPWQEEHGAGTPAVAMETLWAVEAMTLASLAEAGQTPRLTSDTPTITLAVRWQAVMVDMAWRRGREEIFTRRFVPQQSLYPYLVKAARRSLLWGERVSDIMLVDADWRGLHIADVASGQVTLQTGEEEGVLLNLREATLAPVARPDFAARATPEMRPGPGGRRLAGASLELNGVIWATDSGGSLIHYRANADELLGEVALDDAALFIGTVDSAGIVVVSHGRHVYLLDHEGAILHEHELPHRLDVAMQHGDILWLADLAGGLWRWQATTAPELYISLGTRVSDAPIAVAEFPAKWPVRPAGDGALDLDLVDHLPALLVPTEDGFLLTVPLSVN